MATGEIYTTKAIISYVNPPKEGKVNGSIKDAAGNMYFVKPELLDVFQPGHTYEIDYTTSEYPKGSGRFNKWLDSARSANGEGLTPARRPTPPAQSTQKAYAKMQSGGANPEISAVGILKSFIEAGKVELNASAISKAFKTCKAGLLDEMNDEIEF
jgi:hypothetical protein